MKPTKSPPALITLIFLGAFSTMSLNMFVPSLANIATDLETSYSTVSLAVAGYLAATAVIQIIAGPFSDRMGRRPVLLVSLLIFIIASIVCTIATDIRTFLIFRMLQAAIITGYAISLAVIRDTTSERDTTGLIGYLTMAMGIAPMLGPMLGGVLDTAFGWRANFIFYSVAGILLFILCWFDLGETKPDTEIGANRKPENPFSLLREPLFWAYSLCATFSTGAFYIFITGAPLVAQKQFQISTAELGFYMGTITCGFVTGSFLAGRFARKYSAETLIIIGRLVACSGLLIGISIIMMEQLTPVLFFTATIFVGLGNGISMPGSSAKTMSVNPKLAGSAAGFFGAMIVTGGAILTTMTGWILPEESPAFVLLLLMLIASVAGLLAIIAAMIFSARRHESHL